MNAGEKMKETIYYTFGIDVRQFIPYGSYQSFQTAKALFIIVPVSHLREEEVTELYHISQYLLNEGDPYVAVFELTKEGKPTFTHGKELYALLKAAPPVTSRSFQLAPELAAFHLRGRGFPYEVSETKRVGAWKELWAKRLDQLEGFWMQQMHQKPLEPFEKKFIESFPYYLGLTENAIQYLVDTELDDVPKECDSGTVCHQRFSRMTWPVGQPLRLPVDWVFDHPTRDIAEYLRETFVQHKEDLIEEGFSFLQQYEQVMPLSSFSKRLLYSRLLFPLHYFEIVEGYYMSSESDKSYYEERLEYVLNDVSRYEYFLKVFQEMSAMRSGGSLIPAISWINQVSYL
ncbi:spore coat putative kinase YutH [Bacillus sp. NPDC093026]|uniref:spore coat putative kinase YutH n=1 Tax=Bacillus sp. NPDC093026 TaxID=3363948 RepID=UPI0037FF75C9